MATGVVIFLLCLSITRHASSISTVDSDTYKAGVVEFHPSSGNLLEVIEGNLDRYLEIISEAGSQDVDILVFPEATLNRDWIDSKWSTYGAIKVPSKEENVTPCKEKGKYTKILEQISCAAASEKMYIVINVGENAYCPSKSNKCEEGEDVFFNTNVVFDRKGTIISKYRKINLYGENGFIEALNDSYETFETDFNVTFGHFICFDLIFQKPSVQVIEKGNVSNVIFPTMWFSELPSLTAVEIQESFAYAHNVNFLAAGANNPVVGSTGSGIYSGVNGALTSTMNGLNKTILLISEVPKIPGLSNDMPTTKTVKNKNEVLEMDNLYLKTNNMKVYKYKNVDLSKNQQKIQLLYGDSICDFNITIDTENQNIDLKHYEYKAIMFDGVRSFDFKNGGIFECLIIACASGEFSTCAKRFSQYSEIQANIKFMKIEISATVATPSFNISTESLNAVYHPVTLATDIMPLHLNDYTYEIIPLKNVSQQLIKMTTENLQDELLTFGIFGRKFNNDHLPVTGGTMDFKNYFMNFEIFLGIVLSPIISFLINK